MRAILACSGCMQCGQVALGSCPGSFEAASRYCTSSGLSQTDNLQHIGIRGHKKPCQVFYTHCLHYRRPPQLHVCILNLLDATIEHANIIDTLCALEFTVWARLWRYCSSDTRQIIASPVSLAIHSHKLHPPPIHNSSILNRFMHACMDAIKHS